MRENQKSESFILAMLLAIVGGFLDAYTYCCRDKVFANAQTGNIVKLGMSLAEGNYNQTLRFLIPIIAFSLGVLAAMYIRNNNHSKLHWRQVILLFEMVIIVLVSFIPIAHVTNIMANILISFLCALQAESFKKVAGNPYASTMCTGNLRSGTEYFYQALANKDYQLLNKVKYYVFIIAAFIFGAYVGVHITNLYIEKAVMVTLVPMLCCFMGMYKSEKQTSLS